MWCGPTNAITEERDAAGDTAGGTPFCVRKCDVTPGPGSRNLMPGDPGVSQGAIGAIAIFLARVTNTLARRIAAYLHSNPKRAYYFVLACVVGVTFWPHHAKAGPITDLLTNTQDFGTGAISNAILVVGLGLFMTLALMTIGYKATVYAAHHNNSLRGFSNEMIVTGLNLMIPFALLFGIGAFSAWAPSTVANVPAIGQGMGNSIFGSSLSSSVTDLPAIMGQGSTAAWTLLQKIWQAVLPQNASGNVWQLATAFFSGGFLDDITRIIVLIFGFIIAGIIILCFAMMAVEVLMAYIQFYITMPAAAWTLGFHGSDRTEGLANQFWNTVIRALVRFIVVMGVVTWMLMNTASWASDISAASFVATQNILNPDGSINTGASSDIGITKVAIEYLIAAIIMAAVVRRTPDMADAALSGSPALGGTGFAMTAKMGAASFAGGMLGGEMGAMNGGGGGYGGRPGLIGAIGRTTRQGADMMHRLFESGGR